MLGLSHPAGNPRSTHRPWALYGGLCVTLGARSHPAAWSTLAVRSAELGHDLLGNVLHDGSSPRHAPGIHRQYDVVDASLLVGAEAGNHLVYLIAGETGA